ncbi:MAG: membrane protein insertion efficiency factor YidD [Candidatus Levyibacteriota bacterium]|nr:MAG: membrane protein insertion efficiency factor YidD [Candidatus Levybacteria bacterium]
MKHIFIFGIVLYQRVISYPARLILGTPVVCRYSPTCSEYAKIVVSRYGMIKGGYLSLLRILSCQPFSKRYV